MKIELFTNEDWKSSDKIFTHYWYNDGENFFDSITQSFDGFYHYEEENADFESSYDGYTGPTEAYLEQFKENGYSWKELSNIKFTKEDVTSAYIQINGSELSDYPVLFFRVTDDEGYVKYYYSESVGEVSDQNFPDTYVIPLKLDMWATCWIWMHHFMKENEDNVNFLRKMCNRFLFNDPVYEWDKTEEKFLRKQSTGFIIDYLRQPYLMRSADYETQLFVNDTRENFLTLEEFLFINSGKRDRLSYETWIKDYWLKWMNNPYVGTFSPLAKETSGTETVAITDGIGKVQNKYAVELSEGFYDTDFNSNTKYRYLVCRVGNNTLPSKQAADKPKGMFTNFKYDVNYIGSSSKVTCQGIDTSKWTPYLYTYVSKKPFGWYKELDLGAINIGEDAVCVGWDNWLIANKYLTLNFTDNETDNYYVTWTDDLQLKSHRVLLNAYEIGKEYKIIDLPSKSYAFDIYGDTIDVNLTISIRFDSSTSAKLVLRVVLDINFVDVFEHNLTVNNNETSIVNDIYVAQNGTISTEADRYMNGETLMIIPFKKGDWERKYLELLNTSDYGINMGDGSVLGMPVNDIPPSVLAIAMRRQNDESDWQTIGDTLSVRNVPAASGSVKCDLDLVNFNLNNNQIPAIFTDFSYTPITIATAPLPEDIYQCLGGNNFFNDYYQILTKSELTGNIYQINHITGLYECTSGGNTMISEPFLRGPQFWKWSYFIDGTHAIELTGDKIDFKKLITEQNWEVKLNVSFNGATNYFLDISDIKNNKYPMSKLGMEYISGDPSSYPFTTEAYNNWLSTNVSSQDTARNAKDIKNEYAWKRGIVDATVGSLEAGANAAAQSAGRGMFGLKGAAAGAVAGSAVALAHAAGAIAGTALTVNETNKQFENEWQGTLNNYYNSPSHLNPNGFSTGSVIYSPIANANQNSYELFRTFSAPDILREKVWYDISMNGYPFASQCTYNEYNNRLMFNIVNCNLLDKQYSFINYLREKMMTINPIFSNIDYINSFIEKCQKKFRLFKCNYDSNNMENIIAQNIELEREWCDPYFAAQQSIIVDIQHEVSDKQYTDDSWVWSEQYHWTHTEGSTEYLLCKTENSSGFTDYITYKSLGVSNFTEFKNAYSDVYLGNKNSNALMFQKKISESSYSPIKESVASNSSDYGPFGIKLSKETSKQIDVITTNSKINKAVEVKLNDTTYYSKSYELGWKVTLEDDSDKLKVTLIPISQWTFNESVDIRTGTIDNVTEDQKVEDISLDLKLNPKFTFNKKEETLENMFPIYRDTRWFNRFPIKNDSTGKIIETFYYDNKRHDIGGDGPTGAIIDGHLDSITKNYNYNQLGYGFIKTKEDFRKYFKQLKYDTLININYKMRWPKEESENWLKGNLSITLEIPQSSNSSSYKVGSQIGREVFNNELIGNKYKVDKILAQRVDDTIKECFAGEVSVSGMDIVAHKTHAGSGTFFVILTVTLTLYDNYFTITESNQIFYNGYGSHGDTFGWNWGWYGQLVQEGLKNHPDKCYFSISRNNQLEKLAYESKIDNVKLIGQGSSEVSRTKWSMHNIINDMVFVKRPEEM